MMRKLKLTFLGIISVLLLTLVGFSNINVKAANAAVDANITVKGAQIRTTEPVGLRFVGDASNLDTTGVTTYGIVLAFGKTNDTDNFVLNGTINGKEVISGEVNTIDEQTKQYTITLINIPESMYVQEISARAYYKKGDQVTYSNVIITKSLIQGALLEKNAGNNEKCINDVVNYVDDNYVLINNGIVKEDLMEYDLDNLRNEFIKDWNNLFGTTFSKLEMEPFFNSARKGLADNNATDARPSNLYKFFNDDKLKVKWHGVLEFLMTQPGIHPKRQLKAIMSEDGQSHEGDGKLYQLAHLSYSFVNFFNNTAIKTGYDSMQFGNIAKYENLKTLSTTYVDINNYQIEKIGNEYTIKFFDGETELTSIEKKYTVSNNVITLPTYEKEGKVFNGWYDNKEFNGEAVTELASGTTGNKVFYAKMESGKAVNVTFNYNNPKSIDDILNEFIADVIRLSGRNNFLSPATKEEQDYGLDFMPMLQIMNDNSKKQEMQEKWGWLMIKIGDSIINGKYSDESVKNLYGNDVKIMFTSKSTSWIESTRNSRIYAFTQSLKGMRDHKCYKYFAIEFYEWNLDTKDFYNSIMNETITSEMQNLVAGSEITNTPVRDGYTFGGWYDNKECNGTPVTTISDNDIILYAKWNKIA